MESLFAKMLLEWKMKFQTTIAFLVPLNIHMNKWINNNSIGEYYKISRLNTIESLKKCVLLLENSLIANRSAFTLLQS